MISAEQLFQIILIILRPIARFALRRGVRLPDLLLALKIALISEAKAEILASGNPINSSRISVMTGVHRKDVVALSPKPDFETPKATSRDLPTRVISAWQTDKRFRTRSGSPRVLSCSSSHRDFERLVCAVSSDVNPASVRAELLRVGAVQETRNGLRLVSGSYTPSGNIEAGFRMLGDDIDRLTRVVETNVLGPSSQLSLHARTSYDRIRSDKIEEIRQWMLREGHLLHRKAREYLSKFDQDANPSANYAGPTTTVVLGSFGAIDWDKGSEQ